MSDFFSMLAVAATAPSTQSSEVYSFYEHNLRASFFSGFLTLCSFLVAVNTFIVINLKKELYDIKPYQEEITKLGS